MNKPRLTNTGNVAYDFSNARLFLADMSRRCDELQHDLNNFKIHTPKTFIEWIIDGFRGRGWEVSK